MKTFTEVDGVAYPGTLTREHRANSYDFSPYVVSYLSADLGSNRWVSIEIASEDESSAPSNDMLREALRGVIRKKLSDGRLIH